MLKKSRSLLKADSRIKKGQIIAMDNAPFHKSERTKILIESAGCQLLNREILGLV